MPAATGSLVSPDAHRSTNFELTLRVVKKKLERLQETVSSPNVTWNQKVDVRVAACEIISSALQFFIKDAGKERISVLKDWVSKIQPILEGYRALTTKIEDISQLTELDGQMRALGLQKITELHEKTYAPLLCKPHVRDIFLNLFNYIKSIFHCSTLAKASCLTDYYQATIFSAGAPPVGTLSLSRVLSFRP